LLPLFKVSNFYNFIPGDRLSGLLWKSVYTNDICQQAYFGYTMEEYNSNKNIDLEVNKEEEEEENKSTWTDIFSPYGTTLKTMLKKVVTFICYGPGVLGFLWLIGRIFKR